MQALTESIRKRPVVAFYVICYGLSWLLWSPLILSGSELAELLATVGIFGGPGVACIIVARVSPPSIRVGRTAPYWLSFLGAWVVSALILIGYQYQRDTSQGVPFVAQIIFAILALIPAFIVASSFSGSPGVRSTLSSLVRPGGRYGWYLLALFLPLVVRLVSVWVSDLLGWQRMSDPQRPSDLLQLAGSVLAIFLYTLMFAGGLNEEVGWTGFALPRFQARLNPLVSTVLVWILWMLWHVPLHYSGYFDLNVHVLAGSFFGRFLMTWLFIRTSGGILSAMFLHASVNVTSQFVPLTNASILVDGIVAVLVIVGAKMWQRLPESSPAVFTQVDASDYTGR